MLRTLQWYISRELLKTFALSACGLTLVFSLCGGVLNMIQVEVLTAVQVMRILLFILPVATTLTLPVAALFACAVVYGRFAADNEIDACRASGINIHRLLVPAMVLSVFTASFTFAFSNYVIPRFVERLDAIVRADIQKVITQALKSRGYVKYGPYVLSARPVDTPDASEADQKTLRIRDAAFMMLEGEKLSRVGTAEQVFVDFHQSTGADTPIAEASMYGVVALDLAHNQLHEQAHQPFSPMQVPRGFDQNPKFLDLNALIHYLRHPTQFGKIRDEVAKTRLLVRECMFYRYALSELNGPGKTLVLADSKRQYQIRAAMAEHDVKSFHPVLRQVVIVETWDGNRQREYKAGRCTLQVKRGLPNTPDLVHFTLTDQVSFKDSLDPDKVNEPKHLVLEQLPVPAEVLDEATKMSDVELIGLAETGQDKLRFDKLSEVQLSSLGLGPRVDSARRQLLHGVGTLGLKLTSQVHSRVAFSVSSLVMLVLAGGLAIVLRGGQLLTAFAISFVPGLVIVVFNIMGRQLAENPPFHLIGLIVIWASIVLLALADVVVLTKVLRR